MTACYGDWHYGHDIMRHTMWRLKTPNINLDWNRLINTCWQRRQVYPQQTQPQNSEDFRYTLSLVWLCIRWWWCGNSGFAGMCKWLIRSATKKSGKSGALWAEHDAVTILLQRHRKAANFGSQWQRPDTKLDNQVQRKLHKLAAGNSPRKKRGQLTERGQKRALRIAWHSFQNLWHFFYEKGALNLREIGCGQLAQHKGENQLLRKRIDTLSKALHSF